MITASRKASKKLSKKASLQLTLKTVLAGVYESRKVLDDAVHSDNPVLVALDPAAEKDLQRALHLLQAISLELGRQLTELRFTGRCGEYDNGFCF